MGGKEGKRETLKWEKRWPATPYTSYWKWSTQPRSVPWLGIRPWTLCCIGWCSTNLATLVKSGRPIFQKSTCERWGVVNWFLWKNSHLRGPFRVTTLKGDLPGLENPAITGLQFASCLLQSTLLTATAWYFGQWKSNFKKLSFIPIHSNPSL